MHEYLSEEYADLKAVAAKFNSEYTRAQPFPSGSFKNFFNEEMLSRVLEEFPDLSKKDVNRYDDPLQKKLEGKGESLFGPETKKFMHYLNSQPFLEFLQALTGISEPLLGDPYYVGGGLHEIKKGGLLKIHADFNKHPKINLDRRINVLVYLNKEWKEEYGGFFELWDTDMKACVNKVLPEFNTLAMFSTTDFSYHGHPNALDCPDDRSRKSLALYYYSNGRPSSEVNQNQEDHNTLFKARQGDNLDNSAFKPSAKQKVIAIIKDLVPPIIWKVMGRK